MVIGLILYICKNYITYTVPLVVSRKQREKTIYLSKSYSTIYPSVSVSYV